MEVEPAEMNGKGNPVGGIRPLNISYCIINLNNKKTQIITHLFIQNQKLTVHNLEFLKTYNPHLQEPL